MIQTRVFESCPGTGNSLSGSPFTIQAPPHRHLPADLVAKAALNRTGQRKGTRNPLNLPASGDRG
jgi:hypothetical protein